MLDKDVEQSDVMNATPNVSWRQSTTKSRTVPVDIGATPSSGISAMAYYNLMKYLGLGDQRTRVYDVVQQVAQPDDASSTALASTRSTSAAPSTPR